MLSHESSPLAPELGAQRDSSPAPSRNSSRVDHLQLWNSPGIGSIVAGGALAFYGFSRGSATGRMVGVAGSLLALRGLRRAVSPALVHVERSFSINRPVEEVYSYFRNFENLPRFMVHLQSVHLTGERTSHWVARAPLGLEIEWEAEILEEEPNRFLVWRTLPGALLPHRGSVEFDAATAYHGGCRLTVTLEYAPPGGRGAALAARIFGREPGLQLGQDLRRLKQLLECGEIPTIEGQPHGRRSGLVRMMRGIEGSRRQPEERPWAIVG